MDINSHLLVFSNQYFGVFFGVLWGALSDVISSLQECYSSTPLILWLEYKNAALGTPGKKMKQTTFFPSQKHKHDESRKWANEIRLLNQGVLSHSLLRRESKFFHSRIEIYPLLEHSLHDWNRECFRKLHGVWRLEQVFSKRVLLEYSKVMIGKHHMLMLTNDAVG